MRIVLASSEAVPFSKTGGLADVAGALASALADAGHSVWLVVPHYPQVQAKSAGANGIAIEPTNVELDIPIGSRHMPGRVLRSRLPGSAATVLLIDQPVYYDRPGLYQANGADFRDNCERFVFFSRAVLDAVRQLNIRPDVIHANDWQTGLIPALLAIEERTSEAFEHTGSIFTLHNMAFQGSYWHWDMLLTGFDWKYFNWRQLESYGRLNLLKGGIVFADMLTTVSPTYAREIQTPEYGYGLDAALPSRRDDLVGILNGVDTRVWNPQTDEALAVRYSIADVEEGKAACKGQLQEQVGLPPREGVPLFGIISRLTDQKGFDLIAEISDTLFDKDIQLCVLGSGEERYETWLKDLAKRLPEKVAVRLGFDEAFAHRIEAGCDLFLMPSRFEPCGLNQMYSMMYGTVPVVRSVGGLADSVVDANPEHLGNGTATGFSFSDYSAAALLATIERALACYADQDVWRRIVRAGMNQDWSWRRSGSQYVRVYERARAKRRAAAALAVEEMSNATSGP